MKLVGKPFGQNFQVGVTMRMSEYQEVIRPNPMGGPIGEEKRNLTGRECRLPVFRKVENKLVFALNPPIRCFGE